MKQKRLTVKVDPHTFGGSPASENLAKILNDHHPRLVTKVGAYYHKYTEHLTECLYAAQHFPSGSLRGMMELYKQHRFEHIRNSGMPDTVISHLLNVMSTSYKINLRVINRIMASAAAKRRGK
jgi:hypothetical protein